MKRRAAYTLIEVLVALAIGVLLLAALYSALSFQAMQTRASRELIEQTTLVRALFARIGQDVNSTINLIEPARFRNQEPAEAEAAPMTTPMSGTGGMTGTTPMSGATPMADMSDMMEMPPTPPILPLGVMGDSTTLHLFVTKVPNEAFNGELVSDLRRVSYWRGSDVVGLCRAELKVALSEEAAALGIPNDDEATYRLAPEVEALEFEYFDGTSWLDNWDSMTTGPDGITPMGPPRAIAVTLTIRRPPLPNGVQPESKMYRHVIVIPTANGTAQTNTGGL